MSASALELATLYGNRAAQYLSKKGRPAIDDLAAYTCARTAAGYALLALTLQDALEDAETRREHAEEDARDADDSELKHYYGGDE